MDITLYMTIIEEDAKSTDQAIASTQGGNTSPKEDDVSLDYKEKQL
jgi:hypothetical protein